MPDTMLEPEVVRHVRRILDDLDGCTDPVATARLLPREVYTSEAFFAFERAAIFGREWLCVGHVNEIPEPGDQLPITVVDEPIVVVRQPDGGVAALSAVCQHRGHPIFDGLDARSADAPCRRAKRLTCPYHNWSYGLDGRLLAAPSMSETVPLQLLRDTVRLPVLRTEVFHGLIFVNLDADAAPLAPTLAKLDAELATFGLADLVPMPAQTRTGLGWNWKLHHDNALEPYHTRYVHRGVHESAPSDLARFGPFDPGDGQVMHPTYLVSENVGLATTTGERLTPIIEGLTDEQRRRVMFASVPPLLFGIFQPTFVSLSIVLPTGAQEMALRRVNLYPRAAVDDPGFAAAYAAQLERKEVAVQQDQVTLEALQRGYRSRHAPRGPLSWLEGTIPQMNQWLVERYRRSLDALDGATAGAPR